MTIAMVTSPAVGNALRVFLQPPATAEYWRLLRKTANDFLDQNDPNAAVVAECNELVIVDDGGLVNGVTYYYRAYYWDGTTWTPSNSLSGVSASTYEDLTPDVIDVVQQRLQAGLQVEIGRGTLVHALGAIPVYTAPPAYDNSRWPVVTVHLTNQDPAQRFIGESLAADSFADGTAYESEGWLTRVQLSIVSWSTNSDERVALRKALRRIVIANLSVFDAHGFVNVDFGQQDAEDFETYNAPVYQSVCTFSCTAPVAVGSTNGVIAEVDYAITV